MNRFFQRLSIFIENKHKILFLLGLVLIIPSLIGTMQIEMKTGNDTFVSSDSKVYKEYEKFTNLFSDSTAVVLVTADDLNQLIQPDNMAAMQTVEDDMSGKANVISSVGPAFFIAQEINKDGGSSELPTDPQQILDIITDPESGDIKDNFRQVFPDNYHAFIAITIDANLSQSEQADVIKEIEQTVAGAGFDKSADVQITGWTYFMKEMRELQSNNMRNMLILAVVLMLVILAFIFSVRGFFAWRWLPLGVMFLGVIYTFGIMGVLSLPVTMVTMAAFPILIGLGVDYAIQFHNRYDEEIRRGRTAKDAVMESVSHIGPTIGIAIAVACLGFVALFFSPVPMIQDFGLTLIIGVISCYILSTFFLVSILYWHGKRSNHLGKTVERNNNSNITQHHFIDRGLSRIAPVVIRNPAIIITVALLITVAGLIVDGNIMTETDQTKFISSDLTVTKNMNAMKSLGSGLTSTNLLVEAKDVSDPAVLEWMWQVEQRLSNEHSDIVANASSIADIIRRSNGGAIPQDPQEIRRILDETPVPIKRNLITDDLTAANMIVTNREQRTDVFKEVGSYLKDYTSQRPDGVDVTVTGQTQLQVKLFKALNSGREQMTLIGILLVFVGLFVLLRFRILRALVALLPILLIIGWSSVVMYLTGIKYTPITATLGALVIGIGVEFTILLMMRYYEERDKGNRPGEAMTTSIARIGRAIIASGFTVIGGFGALLIATAFPILQEFGLVIMINVFFALVTTLVVMPPLIVLVDRWQERKARVRIK